LIADFGLATGVGEGLVRGGAVRYSGRVYPAAWVRDVHEGWHRRHGQGGQSGVGPVAFARDGCDVVCEELHR
jgi:hypothetical protein